jgi:phosphatidate cytidylyltransferase
VLGGFIVFSPLLGLIIAFFLMVIYFVWAYGYKRELISFLPVVGLGLFYPNLFLGYAFSFTNLSQGRLLLLWSLFIIFVADAGAFYIGSNFGKHKIYSLISPNKSWEGLIGGIGSTLVFGILSTIWLPVSLLKILSLSLIMAILGSIGDFFESVLKRQADIKDSSGILPGHGGLLDRIDGVLFALPVSYYFWQWWLR